MTKLFSIIAVAIVATSFVACGPSAEDKAKAEAKLQHDADSISAMVTAAITDAAVTDAATTTTDVAVDAAATATTAVEAEVKH
jgi:hypothetical protein